MTARADRLVSTSVSGPITHVNGDRATYLDLTFACTWLDGEPYVADDESRDVAWAHREALPEMSAALLVRVEAALSGEHEARVHRLTRGAAAGSVSQHAPPAHQRRDRPGRPGGAA